MPSTEDSRDVKRVTMQMPDVVVEPWRDLQSWNMANRLANVTWQRLKLGRSKLVERSECAFPRGFQRGVWACISLMIGLSAFAVDV